MNRRIFLLHGAATLAVLQPSTSSSPSQPEFHTSNARWQAAYDAALRLLAANVQILPHVDRPVLIEGSVYQGIWMECGPLEALVYRKFRPDVARASHKTFFELQRPDGQLPANNKLKETGFGQIQMVVPIAATAWELARATGDDELLRTAYRSCSAWDAWLLRYRNTCATGLTEGFCTYDTGHDNSPRWAGVANQCPAKDAKNLPASPGVPRLCPDLSATTYGARLALAAMATALGRPSEAERWLASADRMRTLILSRLYDSADAAFYDLDSNGQFVKVRSDVLTRVCGEHVPDQALFDELWTRQLHQPGAFWPAFPLPSVALDDPHFVRPIPRNSWGGASQALTVLRAPRWFEHYGRPAELAYLLDRWCEAIQRDGGFRQQLDPLTGDFTKADPSGYSPCALVLLDSTWRLAGIVEQPDDLHWNIRPTHPAARDATFRLPLDAGGAASLSYTAAGATLRVAGRTLATVTGSVRLVTDKRGVLKSLTGISSQPERTTIHAPGHPVRSIRVSPNQVLAL